MRRRPGHRYGAAVVGALLALLVLGGPAVLAAAAPSSPLSRQQDPDGTDEPAGEDRAAEPDPFDRLTSCIGAGGRLLVVFLIDESASLKQTDPQDQRVDAARAAVTSLDRLRAGTGGAPATDIDILVARFSYDFVPVGDWTRLTSSTKDRLDKRIAALDDRKSSMDTDFYTALDGARSALAQRATSVTNATSAPVCKAIVLFSDGNFSLGVRDTASKVERFPADKPYAPENDLKSEAQVERATTQGIRALCNKGGMADRVRADRITLITVPLVEHLGEGPKRLIEAITTGQKDERECGDPDTDNPGVYLPAADASELLRAFDLVAGRIAGGSLVDEPKRVSPCPDKPCEDGSVTFTVSPSMRRVHIFAAIPDDKTRVVVEPPTGDPLELEPGQDSNAELGGLPADAVWIADRALTVDLEVPADGTGRGEWRVSLVGDPEAGKGLIQVLTFTNLVATLDGGSLALGEESELAAVVEQRGGKKLDQKLAETRISGTITDPITGKTARVTFAPEDGKFVARYTVPDDVTSVSVRLSLRLDATTAEGAELSSVSPDLDLAVRRPAGYPQVAPPRLELTSIDGNGSAEGLLILARPSKGSGCAWLDELTLNQSPPEAGGFTIEAEGIGRGKGECTPVASPVQIPVKIKASGRADGTASGYVRVYVAKAGGDSPIATDIPIAFEMARGIDEAKRLALAAGLMVGGLLFPLVLLALINKLTTRFQTLSHVRAAMVPVVLTGTDRLVRGDYERQSLTLVEEDFHPLEGMGGNRSFTWGGLQFTAKTPLNPFGAPHATIAPASGTAQVSREGRRTDLALGLTGSWLFLLDQDATRATVERIAARGGGTIDSRNEIHGHLVAFVATGAFEGQAKRLFEDISARLPSTARNLARIAKV